MSTAPSLKASSGPNVHKLNSAAATREKVEPQGTLTRQDLALAISEKCNTISKREAKRLVDDVIGQFVSTLTSGETLKLHDFGSFVVRAKGQRSGRNPRTGAKVPIEPRQVVVFKASPNMKAIVNGEGAPEQSALPRVGQKS